MVHKFPELDHVPKERQLTPEGKWCEKHVMDTHVRQPIHHHTVRLPFKTVYDPSQVLGLSRLIALNFHALEQNFSSKQNEDSRDSGEDSKLAVRATKISPLTLDFWTDNGSYDDGVHTGSHTY
ncbi:uncharacterized protein LOC120284706 [Drosophila simulans]|uniref:uncharacterized protein LOC120284706 n=1 Tax=Drosophila simulans TaxID=7240 RepID=UPI00192CE93E|nr:uncharacterized protein LOC120284706 [Drosophila simulans]